MSLIARRLLVADSQRMRIVGVDTYVSATGATTYTSTENIGDAGSDRYIVVVATGRSASTRTCDSCSVGGASTSRIASTTVSSSGFYPFAIFITNDPFTSGTTASISVTFSGSMSRAGFHVFALYAPNGINLTPHHVVYSDTTINQEDGGVLVGGSANASTVNTNWTGLIEYQDTAFGTSSLSSASLDATATGSLSIASSNKVVIAAVSLVEP
jgi:hypothetical protein